ncbi:MAG: cobalamin-dependent protein [Pseudomonadota bacterium]
MAGSASKKAKEAGGRSGQERKKRVLLTKSRMDGHDRGVRHVARELRNAGMEVVFTRYALPEEIVSTAIQEGSDVIGVSCSTGGHLYVAERIQDCLKREGVKDIKVLFGGIIPDLDGPRMKERGVTGIFGPGSSIQEIIRAITG